MEDENIIKKFRSQNLKGYYLGGKAVEGKITLIWINKE
jgi:hypothetical protein